MKIFETFNLKINFFALFFVIFHDTYGGNSFKNPQGVSLIDHLPRLHDIYHGQI